MSTAAPGAGRFVVTPRTIVLLAAAAFSSSVNLRICDSLLPQLAGDFSASIGANSQSPPLSSAPMGTSSNAEFIATSSAGSSGSKDIGTSESATWSQLSSIRLIGASSTPAARLLQLVDGSQLAFQTMQGKNDLWSVDTSQGRFDVGKNGAAWLRFRTASTQEEIAWKAMVDSKVDSDLLVIARGEGLLDRAQGMVVEMSTDLVKFDYEGQVIEAPLSKLLGVIWLRTGGNRIEPLVRVRTKGGSQWMARELTWSTGPKNTSESLVLVTPLGMKVEIKPEDLLEVDFSIANLKWLCNASVVTAIATPRISFKQPLAEREAALRPRFVLRQEDGGDQDRDLLFPSPGEVVFRVPDQVSKFVSTVVRSSQGDYLSELTIEVWENDQKLNEVKLGVDADVVKIVCDVHVDKRLKLLVKTSAGLMAGSEVKWLQPRFLR